MPQVGAREEVAIRYSRKTEIVSAMLGQDEIALLSAARGKYYGLNSPATRIWELLDSPKSIEELTSILMAEYDVAADECRQQTRELVAELVAENLVAEVK